MYLRFYLSYPGLKSGVKVAENHKAALAKRRQGWQRKGADYKEDEEDCEDGVDAEFWRVPDEVDLDAIDEIEDDYKDMCYNTSLIARDIALPALGALSWSAADTAHDFAKVARAPKAYQPASSNYNKKTGGSRRAHNNKTVADAAQALDEDDGGLALQEELGTVVADQTDETPFRFYDSTSGTFLDIGCNENELERYIQEAGRDDDDDDGEAGYVQPQVQRKYEVVQTTEALCSSQDQDEDPAVPARNEDSDYEDNSPSESESESESEDPSSSQESNSKSKRKSSHRGSQPRKSQKSLCKSAPAAAATQMRLTAKKYVRVEPNTNSCAIAARSTRSSSTKTELAILLESCLQRIEWDKLTGMTVHSYNPFRRSEQFDRYDFGQMYDKFLPVRRAASASLSLQVAEQRRCFPIHLGIAIARNPFLVQSAFRFFAAQIATPEPNLREPLQTVLSPGVDIDPQMLQILWLHELDPYKICIVSDGAFSTYSVHADAIPIIIHHEARHFTLIRPKQSNKPGSLERLVAHLLQPHVSKFCMEFQIESNPARSIKTMCAHYGIATPLPVPNL